MDWFVRAFRKASLVWLSLAVLLAVAMAVWPAPVVYRTAHLQMAMLAAGGILSAAAAGCFVVNLWRTMDRATMRGTHSRGKPLTTLPQADAH